MRRFLRIIALALLAVLPFAAAAPAVAATTTGAYVYDNSSLANFQSWAGAIHNAFITFGWVQTSDSGQTVPSAAAAVPTNTYLNVIYKANDSLAATMPIYVKFEYGYSSTSPRIRFTVGTGSSGSGAITGNVVGPFEVTTLETNQGTSTFPSFFSGTAGVFSMSMWNHTVAPYTGFIFAIDRSKSSSGADTGTYVTVFAASAYNSMSGGTSGCSNAFTLQQSFSSSYLYRCQTGLAGVAITNTTYNDNGTTAALPVFPIVGNIGNPTLGVMCVEQNDVSDGSTVTVGSLYGTVHTYVAASSQYLHSACAIHSQASGGSAILVRYE